MREEDFTLGYVCGYNDAGGGASGGGLIIPEGTIPIYNVPILHNYVFTGTEFGLGTIDINNCTFLNSFTSWRKWSYTSNVITDEPYLYQDGVLSNSRQVAAAITKNGTAIALIPLGTYTTATSGSTHYRLVDGNFKEAHGNISASIIENQQITTIERESGTTTRQMFIYLEYDIVTTTEVYKNGNSKYGTYVDSSGQTQSYSYYDEADIDVYQETTTSTRHVKQQIRMTPAMLLSKPDKWCPDELLNVYQLGPISMSAIWGTNIETMRDFSLSLATGLSG